MRPEIIIENTLRPEQFVAATAVGVTGAVTAKGGNTFLLIFLALVALGFGFWAYQNAKDQAEERVRQMQPE